MSLQSVGASMVSMIPVQTAPVQKKDPADSAQSNPYGSFDLEEESNAAYSSPNAPVSTQTPPSSNSATLSAAPLPSQAPDPSSLTGVTVYNASGQVQSLSSNAGQSLNLSA